MEEENEQLATVDDTSEAVVPVTDVSSLSKESTELINQIIHESDSERIKDLTYLFNINYNKKTMIRQNQLDKLQSIIIEQLITRYNKKPDEISTTDLMTALKTVQDVMERSAKQINGVNEQTPLITINQQNNEVNIGNEKPLDPLNRASREKVMNAVTKLLKGLSTTPDEQVPQEQPEVIDATVEVKEKPTEEEPKDDGQH